MEANEAAQELWVKKKSALRLLVVLKVAPHP